MLSIIVWSDNRGWYILDRRVSSPCRERSCYGGRESPDEIVQGQDIAQGGGAIGRVHGVEDGML